MLRPVLKVTERQLKNRIIVRHGQYGFMKRKSCFSNFIFYDKVAGLVNEGKKVDVKTFDTVPQLDRL